MELIGVAVIGFGVGSMAENVDGSRQMCAIMAGCLVSFALQFQSLNQRNAHLVRRCGAKVHDS